MLCVEKCAESDVSAKQQCHSRLLEEFSIIHHLLLKQYYNRYHIRRIDYHISVNAANLWVCVWGVTGQQY